MTASDRPLASPEDVDAFSDRLSALANAAHIIRLTTAGDDAVVAAALRTIEVQVEHLSQWVERLVQG